MYITVRDAVIAAYLADSSITGDLGILGGAAAVHSHPRGAARHYNDGETPAIGVACSSVGGHTPHTMRSYISPYSVYTECVVYGGDPEVAEDAALAIMSKVIARIETENLDNKLGDRTTFVGLSLTGGDTIRIGLGDTGYKIVSFITCEVRTVSRYA